MSRWGQIRCPSCDHKVSRVIDSRGSQRYGVRRRRECCSCHYRFSTSERVIPAQDNPSIDDLERHVGELQQLLMSMKRQGKAA